MSRESAWSQTGTCLPVPSGLTTHCLTHSQHRPLCGFSWEALTCAGLELRRQVWLEMGTERGSDSDHLLDPSSPSTLPFQHPTHFLSLPAPSIATIPSCHKWSHQSLAEAWRLLLWRLLPHSAIRRSAKKFLEFIRLFSIFSVATLVQATSIFARREELPCCFLSSHYCLPWNPLFHSKPLTNFTKQSPSCLSLAYMHFLPIAWDKGQAHSRNPSQSPLEPVFQMMGTSVSTKSFSLSGL